MRNINNKYFAIPVAVVAILFSACSSEDIVEEKGTSTVVSGQKNVLTADLTDVNVTRTTLDGLVVNWADDDHIGVFVEAQGCSYPLASNDYKIKENNQTYASFESASDVKTDEDGTYYAVYPYNSNVNLSSDKKVSFTIPTSSPEVGYHSEFHFMTAKTAEGSKTLSFKAAVAYLKLEIKHSVNYDNFKPTKITLTAVGGEKLNGTYSVTIGDNGTPSIITDNIGVDGSKVITIGGVDANEDNEEDVVETGVYYIPVIPQTYSQGIAIKMEDNRAGNKKEFDRVSNTNLQIAFNDIVNLGTYSTKKIGKEAYVNLGLKNGTKWCIENVYDDESGKTSEIDNSFYAWGETYVKANQVKLDDVFKTYSWYYNYNFGEGTQSGASEQKRSYNLGVGASNWNAFTSSESYSFTYTNKLLFIPVTYTGVLNKYNSSNSYLRSTGDWTGGKKDDGLVLDNDDDAAYQKSPLKRVQIPTEEDFKELNTAITNKTLSISTTIDNSYKIQNVATGYYIILPAKGYRFKSSENDSDDPKEIKTAAYWTKNRSSNAADSYKARSCVISTNNSTHTFKFSDEERAQGRLLRGVIK